MATAKEILAVARGELGYREDPPGSNLTKYGKWFGLNGNPWCMMFIQWCFWQAGAYELLPAHTGSCGAFMRAAQAQGRWVTGDYQPGDVVIYNFPGNSARTDHCGIVVTALTTGIRAIEGNTGAESDANGGQVQERTRPTKFILGAYRPDYDEDEEEDVTRYIYLKDIPEKFRPTIERLMDAGIIQGDGSDPTGNGDVIDLSHDQVRTLVFIYRGGGFDAKLRAAGLDAAVK